MLTHNGLAVTASLTALFKSQGLRDQLRRLRDELERKRDRLPTSFPRAFANAFHRKIDSLLVGCMDVERSIRSREDQLNHVITLAGEMEEEVERIMRGQA